MLQRVDLHLEPNEASDLTQVREPGLLEAHGWDAAYLTVLDEGPVEDCVAVLGHDAGAAPTEGWTSARIHLDAGDMAGRTEDAEAITVRDGVVYVVGSHYGSKDGPLQPRRAWFGRLRAEDLAAAIAGERPPLELARNRFALHRAVNDALQEAGVALQPLGARARELLVGATVTRGEEGGKRWAGRVRPDDHPVNVEGMEFRPSGELVLGLRYPVTEEGHPLLVAVEDVDVLFADDPEAVRCGPVWTVRAGRREDPVGVRGLHHGDGDALHLVVGSLDAEGKDSALVDERPDAGRAHCEHWAVELPAGAGPGELAAREVHGFPGLKTVEGIAQAPDGSFLYVVDQDHNVHLRFLLLD
jgi:hypothetical protein